MATTTSNLKLTLPAVNDAADIAVLNNNFQLLDVLGGYGVGRPNSMFIDPSIRLSAITTGGMYYWNSENTDPDKPFTRGELLVIPRGGTGYLDQIAFGKDSTVPQIRIRQCMDVGSWSGWQDWSPSAFAPSGYGLGTSATYVVDLNNAKENGFYYWNTAAVNAPFNPAHGGGEMIVLKRNENAAHQIAYDATMVNSKCVRQYTGGTWGEWEYVNPPMILGVEYRTTERWQGKPVYTKLLNFGTMPNATNKTVDAGIQYIDSPISITVTAISSTWCFVLPSSYTQETKVLFSKNIVEIETTVDRSNYTAYALLKYTKL